MAASIKEIRKKITSVQATQKITKAMEMVAASKMQEAKHRREASKPYAEKIREVIHHVASGALEYHHPFMTVRPLKRAGYIIVSTDRGLCGGLNVNLFRKICGHMHTLDKQKVEISYATIGHKAESFFKRMPGTLLASLVNLGHTPALSKLLGGVRVMLEAYEQEQIDQIFLAYNRFVNTMTQSPEIEQLLPLEKPKLPQGVLPWDYIYEPEPRYLLDLLLTRYVESLVYQAHVENGACEQSARMIAMKSATDNAAEMIHGLELAYNKARQASITQELSEIVAGADAV